LYFSRQGEEKEEERTEEEEEASSSLLLISSFNKASKEAEVGMTTPSSVEWFVEAANLVEEVEVEEEEGMEDAAAAAAMFS
jgi:hypothetical protein